MPINFVSVSTAAVVRDNRAMHYIIEVYYIHGHHHLWFTDRLATYVLCMV